MLPDRVSNPGPLTYESGARPIAPRDPAQIVQTRIKHKEHGWNDYHFSENVNNR